MKRAFLLVAVTAVVSVVATLLVARPFTRTEYVYVASLTEVFTPAPVQPSQLGSTYLLVTGPNQPQTLNIGVSDMNGQLAPGYSPTSTFEEFCGDPPAGVNPSVAFPDMNRVFVVEYAVWLGEPSPPVFTFVSSGSGGDCPRQFNAPTAIAEGNNRVYVVDSGNCRIMVLDSAGNFMESEHFGCRGSGPGEFLYPMDIAIGPDGQIYVADTGNSRVQQFNRNREFVGAFEVPSLDPYGGSRPTSINVQKDGTLRVTDAANNRLLTMKPAESTLLAALNH